MQRWALLLSAYSYDIEFRPTQSHANAAGLSRLPAEKSQLTGNPVDPTVVNIAQVECLPVTASTLMSATRNNPVLSKVLCCLRKGWPQQIPDILLPYWRKRNELTIEEDSILWGVRVIVPAKIREQVVDELHRSHPGIMCIKSLARSHVWWPEIDKSPKTAGVVLLVKRCEKVRYLATLLGSVAFVPFNPRHALTVSKSFI